MVKNVATPRDGEAEDASICPVLADTTRLRILARLTAEDELSVLELCRQLGQNQSLVGHCLNLLCLEGLVEKRRRGQHNYYTARSGRQDHLLHFAIENYQA